MIVMAYCPGSNDKAWRPPGFLMGPSARFAAVLTFLSSLPLEKGKNDTIWGYQVTPASGEKDGLRRDEAKEGLANKIDQAICSGPNLLI